MPQRIPAPCTLARVLMLFSLGATVLMTLELSIEVVPAAADVPPGTEPHAVPRSSTPPAGTVPIGVDENATQVVASHPANTTFVIESGVHQRFSVIARSGDQFYAQPGAVLDGDNSVLCAIRVPVGATANDVGIIGPSQHDPLLIENYGANHHSQTATIQTNTQVTKPPQYSSGWWLQWVTVTGSGSRGISLSDDMVVLGARVVDNDRLGIGGSGDGVTVADSVIADNGLSVARRGWEAGGIKTIAHDVLIEHDQISGNGAPGVWTDGGASDVDIVDNHFSDNRFGIRVEISHDVDVASNSISGSLQQAILVIASAGVTVEDNTIDDNFGGIIVGGVGTQGPDGIELNNVAVTQNLIEDSGTTGLHQLPPAGTVITFDRDRYVHEHLQWDGHGITFGALQELGQERDGSWAA